MISKKMEKPTILIADDEPGLLENLSLLYKDDFRILTASNGKEAYLIFKADPSLSLILLDLDMPVMKGTEVLEKIRDISNDVKIIIMTGRSSHEYAKKCASLNVQGYVEKPFEVKQLKAQIKRQLGLNEFKVLKNLWTDDYEERFYSMSDINKRTVCYLEKHHDERLNIKELSARLMVSHEHLSRIFHRECGIRLKDYIRKVRIEKGKESLINNRFFSIKEVASSVGMNDDKHFCRLFKKETGLTPGQYRKSKLLT